MERTSGKELISRLPYGPGFLFVDGIQKLNSEEIIGYFSFKSDWPVFSAHFPDHPVVPGVLLTECAAQIALATHGLYLTRSESRDTREEHFVLTEVHMDYLKPVYPSEIVYVKGNPIYFRFNKLKTKVELRSEEGWYWRKGPSRGWL